MKLDTDPNRNRPTLGTLLATFLGALLTWGLTFVPDTVPGEVVATGTALALFAIGAVVGWIVQNVGEHAPWAVDMHTSAVAYALELDPDAYRDDMDARLRKLGINPDDVPRLLGVDQDDEG